ncbi:exopolyphosphatase/guanosine-5'-triphosphate,3'-diphosphate pyrophosphatase [Nonomuraea polychroma]|uniref:Exopolyphosphatase/guanosine-5'-triphosphate, 3'-diphosphate pyrophosphatase n=1 Tax=Nonomuraea polychroma TaxID=46176 RepID=A0A438M3Z4_9ACTN|nr:Ppx/GppA phosphatase family protein [Nonomuraea polychroma]RVX40586.1 exopolyphosphatase/guanosine-5'-triphosphate,3'-diphosphate pyrophosphatase [Nonomuraea polychroma]
MRLGVLDIGSNTVHLLVVDAHRGARPIPAFSHKEGLRLTEYLRKDNRLAEEGIERLCAFVQEAVHLAEDKGVEDLLAFATSAVREAANGEEVLARVEDSCGVHIEVLSGRDEARLTFLAVRRWFGWSSGRLLAFDIGGGSLEIAAGVDEEPDVAVSLPLGAGRLTRDWFTADPPAADEVRKLRKHVRTEIARTVGDIVRYGEPNRAVATSKTFKQLARIAGAAPSSDGPYVARSLSRQDMAEWAVKLTTMNAAERAELSGVSEGRAAQLAAGALVADAAMDLFEVDRLEVCPWALREGVILRRLDLLPGRHDQSAPGSE